MNVLFERSDRFEKEVGDRLPVNLHQIGDLLVVHAFEVFEEDGFFLATGQFFNGAANFDLILTQQLLSLNFGFYRLVVGELAGFVDVEERVRASAAAKLLHELVAQCTQEINGDELNLDVLALFPNVDHQVLDRVFDELPVGREIAGVVEKRAVLLIGQLAKRQTVPGLALVPEI